MQVMLCEKDEACKKQIEEEREKMEAEFAKQVELPPLPETLSDFPIITTTTVSTDTITPPHMVTNSTPSHNLFHVPFSSPCQLHKLPSPLLSPHKEATTTLHPGVSS